MIDWDAPLSAEANFDHVEVPPTNNPLTTQDYTQLCQEVDPHGDSSYYGRDLYLAAVHFVEAKLSQY